MDHAILRVHQVLPALSQRVSPPLSLSPGYVVHVFLTRPPLIYPPVTRWINPLDLHALATPPAFVLSQDQTLQLLFVLHIRPIATTLERKLQTGRSDAKKRLSRWIVDERESCP